jgi:tetratricopeptide (TPR) repeat protein
MNASKLNVIPAALLALGTMGTPAQTIPAPGARPRPSAQKPAADPLQEAESLLEKQQYAQAAEKIQALMPDQAKNPQAWFDLGFAQSHLGDAKAAAASYQKAVDLAPSWFEANLNLGLDLVKSGNPAAAVTVLKHTVELKPSNGSNKAMARAWLSLAEAMEEAGADPKGAAAAYDKAAELNQSDAGLSVRAGALLQRAGDLAGAEQHYQKAAESGNTQAIGKLIDLFIAQKRYADAEGWLNKRLAQNAQDATTRLQLGRLQAAEGKNQEAIATLLPLSGAAASPEINRDLADLYLAEKQYAEAAPLLQQLLENNGKDAQLHMDLGAALLHQHKYPEAEAELLRAVQLKPDLADAYFDLAYAAQQNKHYDLSLRALDARAKSKPETAGTYWLRATSYDSLGAYKPAAENYKLFLAASGGKSPEQEFQARHRLKAITPQ